MGMEGRLYSTDVEEAIIEMMDLHGAQDQRADGRQTRFGISCNDSRKDKRGLKLISRYDPIIF